MKRVSVMRFFGCNSVQASAKFTDVAPCRPTFKADKLNFLNEPTFGTDDSNYYHYLLNIKSARRAFLAISSAFLSGSLFTPVAVETSIDLCVLMPCCSRISFSAFARMSALSFETDDFFFPMKPRYSSNVVRGSFLVAIHSLSIPTFVRMSSIWRTEYPLHGLNVNPFLKPAAEEVRNNHRYEVNLAHHDLVCNRLPDGVRKHDRRIKSTLAFRVMLLLDSFEPSAVSADAAFGQSGFRRLQSFAW